MEERYPLAVHSFLQSTRSTTTLNFPLSALFETAVAYSLLSKA